MGRCRFAEYWQAPRENLGHLNRRPKKMDYRPQPIAFTSAMPPALKSHTIHLHTPRLHLRPMTDADWDILLRWNQDPDVLYYADGADVTAYTLD